MKPIQRRKVLSNLLAFIGGGTVVASAEGAVRKNESGSNFASRISKTNFREFGAIGDGIADDTLSIQAALDSDAREIRGTAGDVYLTGPLISKLDDRLLDLVGCKLILRPNSVGVILSIRGARTILHGGVFDSPRLDCTCVAVLGSKCVVEQVTVQGAGACGILVTNNAQYTTIANNFVASAQQYGIYVEGISAHCYGNRILNNIVKTDSQPRASGIYLTGQNEPYKFQQKQWSISGNHVIGAQSGASGAGITCRAVDGQCTGNSVIGYTLGITCDITCRSVVSGNRIEGVGGAIAFGIEVNGNSNCIANNFVSGARRGIVLSANLKKHPNTPSLDGNNISANVLEAISDVGVYVSGEAGATANFCSINSNTISILGAGVGIRLAHATTNALLNANVICGQDSVSKNGAGVVLDGTGGLCNVTANYFGHLAKAVVCYANAQLIFQDVHLVGNEYSCGVELAQIVTGGAAVFGKNCASLWNFDSSGASRSTFDHAAKRLVAFGEAKTPNGAVDAGRGSIYIGTGDETGPSLFVKDTPGISQYGWSQK